MRGTPPTASYKVAAPTETRAALRLDDGEQRVAESEEMEECRAYFGFGFFGSAARILRIRAALTWPPVETISASLITTSQLQTATHRFFSNVPLSHGISTCWGGRGSGNDVVSAATTISSPAWCPLFKTIPGRHLGFWPRGSSIVAQTIVPCSSAATLPVQEISYQGRSTSPSKNSGGGELSAASLRRSASGGVNAAISRAAKSASFSASAVTGRGLFRFGRATGREASTMCFTRSKLATKLIASCGPSGGRRRRLRFGG